MHACRYSHEGREVASTILLSLLRDTISCFQLRIVFLPFQLFPLHLGGKVQSLNTMACQQLLDWLTAKPFDRAAYRIILTSLKTCKQNIIWVTTAVLLITTRALTMQKETTVSVHQSVNHQSLSWTCKCLLIDAYGDQWHTQDTVVKLCDALSQLCGCLVSKYFNLFSLVFLPVGLQNRQDLFVSLKTGNTLNIMCCTQS